MESEREEKSTSLFTCTKLEARESLDIHIFLIDVGQVKRSMASDV